MRPVLDEADVAEQYRRFAREECGSSPTYAALARACASDETLMGRLAQRPRIERQPNLVFGCLRLTGAPVQDPVAAVQFLHTHWGRIEPMLATRRTQTNELARCAAFVAALSAVPGPVALLEVGASAGLCLLPDRWDYRYRGDVELDVPHTTGEGGVVVDCTVTLHGAASWPLLSMPDIRWRAGLDLHPLDPGANDTRDWLTALVWPEHEHRRRRLGQGLDLAAQDPPRVVAGDLEADLEDLLTEVPQDLTLVVQHAAVLAYLDESARAAFLRTIAQAGRTVYRLGQEGARVMPGPVTPLTQAADRDGWFVLSLDETVLGVCAPHGGELRWAGPSAG